jgi:hypothetical protein
LGYGECRHREKQLSQGCHLWNLSSRLNLMLFCLSI